MRPLASLLACLCLGAALVQAQVRIVGSDLLGEPFAEVLTRYGEESGLPVALALEGSWPGRQALERGTADLALLAVPLDEEPPGEPFLTLSLGYHIAVVAVSEKLGIEQLALNQIGGVFGASETTATGRWGDLGVRGEFAARALAPQVLAGRSGALSSALFRHVVLQTPAYRTNVVMHETWQDAVESLAFDAGAILVLPYLPPPSARAKALALAPKMGELGYAPTPENVHSGAYPLRIPIKVVVRRDQAGQLMLLLRFLLSEEVAEALDAGRVMPVPISARNQQVFDLEALQ